MTPIPLASFQAGALLSLLLPIGVLLALTVWYGLFLRHAGFGAGGAEPTAAPGEAAAPPQGTATGTGSPPPAAG